MLKPVAEHAEKEGVLLLIEPEPGLLIETADQFLELMEQVDSPAIGLNFDIGHFYCVGDEPAPTVHRLAPYIRHFHLEDIAATRVHHHLIPGEGAIDFAAETPAVPPANTSRPIFTPTPSAPPPPAPARIACPSRGTSCSPS